MGKEPWPIFLHGNAGVGKTVLTLALMECIGGEYEIFSDFCDYMIQVRNGDVYESNLYNRWKVFPNHVWQRIRRHTIYTLDEIGLRERTTDFQHETLKRILDIRDGMASIFISNISPEGLNTIYDDRIVSRMCCGTIIELKGKDRRME
jgi:DNA replication protein DnaC